MPPTPIEFIARGLFVHRTHCLVCWNPKGGYGYLPGGHIESEEPAEAALAREMIEETGLACRVGPLLLTHENRFRTRKRAHHELNLVFAAELTDRAFLAADSKMCHVAQSHKTAISPSQKGSKTKISLLTPPPPILSAEPHLTFKWLTASQFQKVDIRPDPMAKWALQVMKSGLNSTVGLRPTDAPSAQCLSTMNL
jgi:ADP-ribose pyrophosphatase YjhB (NUDIX family)